MTKPSKARELSRQPQSPWLASIQWGVVFLTGLLLAWAGRFALQLIRADLAFIEPRHQISQWIYGRETYTYAQWAKAYERMRFAISVSPENPVLHEYMASLLALRGQTYWKSDVLRNAFFLDARRHQQMSLKLRPTNGRTWAGLALSLHALDEDGWSLNNAISQSLVYAPHDARVQRQIAAVVMARWNSVEPAHRNWVRAAYQDERSRQRLQLDKLAKMYGIRFV